MSKINSLRVKEYSNIIILVEWMDLYQSQISLCWGELDITNENNYKWERNRSYFIDLIYLEVHSNFLIKENSILIKKFVV